MKSYLTMRYAPQWCIVLRCNMADRWRGCLNNTHNGSKGLHHNGAWVLRCNMAHYCIGIQVYRHTVCGCEGFGVGWDRYPILSHCGIANRKRYKPLFSRFPPRWGIGIGGVAISILHYFGAVCIRVYPIRESDRVQHRHKPKNCI